MRAASLQSTGLLCRSACLTAASHGAIDGRRGTLTLMSTRS